MGRREDLEQNAVRIGEDECPGHGHANGFETVSQLADITRMSVETPSPRCPGYACHRELEQYRQDSVQVFLGELLTARTNDYSPLVNFSGDSV